jgi:hypothetical protein
MACVKHKMEARMSFCACPVSDEGSRGPWTFPVIFAILRSFRAWLLSKFPDWYIPCPLFIFGVSDMVRFEALPSR